MKIFRKSDPAPPHVLSDYVTFFAAAHMLDDADAQAIGSEYEQLGQHDWYVQAANMAHELADTSGRVSDDGFVTGEVTDPDHADVTALRDVVGAGAAVDVAIAILVSDLLPKKQYGQITNHWGNYPSAWLPGKDHADQQEQEPEPEPEPAPEPVRQQNPAPRPRPRPRTSGDPIGAGAEPVTEPAGTIPMPSTKRPAPTRPVHVPPEKVMSVAARRALDREHRRRSSGWARARANVLLVLGLFGGLFAAGDQLGPQILPPASIGPLGDGWGHLICALLWIAIGIILIRLAAGQYRLATSIKRGR